MNKKQLLHQSLLYREGVDGAQFQVVNAGKQFGVAVVKRRLKPAHDAYAVMPLDAFLNLVKSGK